MSDEELKDDIIAMKQLLSLLNDKVAQLQIRTKMLDERLDVVSIMAQN